MGPMPACVFLLFDVRQAAEEAAVALVRKAVAATSPGLSAASDGHRGDEGGDTDEGDDDDLDVVMAAMAQEDFAVGTLPAAPAAPTVGPAWTRPARGAAAAAAATDATPCPVIHHGEPFTDRKSTFQVPAWSGEAWLLTAC